MPLIDITCLIFKKLWASTWKSKRFKKICMTFWCHPRIGRFDVRKESCTPPKVHQQHLSVINCIPINEFSIFGNQRKWEWSKHVSVSWEQSFSSAIRIKQNYNLFNILCLSSSNAAMWWRVFVLAVSPENPAVVPVTTDKNVTFATYVRKPSYSPKIILDFHHAEEVRSLEYYNYWPTFPGYWTAIFWGVGSIGRKLQFWF